MLVVKNWNANAGDIRDMGSIPGSGRSLAEEMATHSGMLAHEQGDWWATVLGVTESQT